MWTVETFRKSTGDIIRSTTFDFEAEMKEFLEKSGKPSDLMGLRIINNARAPQPVVVVDSNNPYGIYPQRKLPKLKKQPPPDIIA